MTTALTQVIVKDLFFIHNPLPEGEGIGWPIRNRTERIFPRPLSFWERAAKNKRSIKITSGEGR